MIKSRRNELEDLVWVTSFLKMEGGILTPVTKEDSIFIVLIIYQFKLKSKENRQSAGIPHSGS